MRFLAYCVGVMLVLGCASQPSDSRMTDQQFSDFASALWQAEQKRNQAQEGRLADLSAEHLAVVASERKQWLDRLAVIEVESLSEQNQINHAVLTYRLANSYDQYRFGAHRMPLTAESGFHNSLAFMAQRGGFRQTDDFEQYLSRLEDMPRYFQQQIDWMRQGIADGMTQPQEVLTGFEQSIIAYVTEQEEDNVFYTPFRRQPEGIADAEWQQLTERARQAIRDAVNPSYQSFYQFFVDEYYPNARQTLAAGQLPDGEAYYQNRLEHYTTLQMTPAEIHQIGLDEVARIRAEMQQVIDELEFEGSFADFVEFLRTDPQFYAETPRELMMYAAYLSKKADAALPQFFQVLPRTPYGVEPVPAEIAPKYTTGRYVSSNRSTAPGYYWVNTYALNRRPLYEMEALTLHEAVPGHHLQVALSQEQDSLPDYRRSFYTSAFGEGWGLYAEYLGLEMGFYQNPYYNFGRLSFEMWRAVRLVVDTGLHAKGWSRQEAIDFLANNSALSMHNVVTEIDRYISWPGQALSYKLGEITIRRLRQEAEAALGSDFDIREFHDEVLKNGSVPLQVLERQINRYIEQKQQAG
ncbi:DUF885 domain-containing protein [Alkalimonas collagenimarina]|uniref:DUF885 domain-containing protein n=1 Tax=Alkalimonas collagenimarina TaxID=400390 RepID=A0ABT9GX73_9GAMM|nr:DUF885 domain-containing protein [Alkalimonas collagenimarina]MDP4535653.1 DUF885 domain-containing protein [Alkalimonas collagenimarina]